MQDVTGFVLAGGKSTRMGCDKAFVQLDGETLLARTLRTVRAVAPEVYILGAAEKYGASASVIEDRYPQRGPLGGIHAALSSTATELNLVVAVDMPLLRAETLAFLLERARRTQKLVTVPRVAGHVQTLCAVYRAGFLPRVEQALANGRNKPDALFLPDITDMIEESELPAGVAAEFANVNTPQELAHASQASPDTK